MPKSQVGIQESDPPMAVSRAMNALEHDAPHANIRDGSKTRALSQLEERKRMPLLKLETTANLSDQSRSNLLTKLSRIVTDAIGNPEQYVMVAVSHSDIVMSGKAGTAA